MAITFRGSSQAHDQGGTVDGVVLDKPAGVVEGDIMFAIVVGDNDTGGIGNVGAPSGWDLVGSSSATGTVGVYQRIAGASEPASYMWTDNQTAGLECDFAGGLVAFYGDFDASDPIKTGPTFSVGSASTSFVAPSVAGYDGAYLICGFLRSEGSNTAATFTMPGGMDERADVSDTAWVSAAIGTEALTADASTGTRTATCSDSSTYTTVSFVLGAVGDEPPPPPAPGPTPTWVSAGTFSSGAAGATPGLPAGWQADDIFLLFLENRNGGAGQVPAGWTVVANSPQYANTGTNTTRTNLDVLWRRATASETAPAIGDTGNHVLAVIHAFRGCVTEGDPWDATSGSVETSSDTSGVAPAVTTVEGNRLVVVGACGHLSGSVSTPVNANLTSLSERSDDNSAAGDDGTLAVYTGEKAAAGSTGTTSLTYSTSMNKGLLTIALTPVPAPAVAGVSSVGILIG